MFDNDKIVSFDDEKLIVVDENDNAIDYKSKTECHNGEGILHRAFSIFIFNDQNQLLVQKRSKNKRLWPLFWSTSCCSHPRKGEDIELAAQRRLKEEIGITTPLTFLFRFQYHSKYKDVGSEREICSVYIGKSNATISANVNEIAAWKFIDIDQLQKDMATNPQNYSPWFLMEWERISRDHLKDIEKL